MLGFACVLYVYIYTSYVVKSNGNIFAAVGPGIQGIHHSLVIS